MGVSGWEGVVREDSRPAEAPVNLSHGKLAIVINVEVANTTLYVTRA